VQFLKIYIEAYINTGPQSLLGKEEPMVKLLTALSAVLQG